MGPADTPPSPAAPAGSGALRILVVDDVPDVYHLARMLLTRRGAKVVTADGGEEALEVLAVRQASAEPIDVVLSDYMMPMNGGMLLREVRARYPGLPVIIYSAAMHPELREELLAAGAGDALDKGALTPDGIEEVFQAFARARASGSDPRIA